MAKKCAFVNRKYCAACGACLKVCPRGALTVWKGCYAKVDSERCVGCGLCQKTCPANAILVKDWEVAE